MNIEINEAHKPQYEEIHWAERNNDASPYLPIRETI